MVLCMVLCMGDVWFCADFREERKLALIRIISEAKFGDDPLASSVRSSEKNLWIKKPHKILSSSKEGFQINNKKENFGR